MEQSATIAAARYRAPTCWSFPPIASAGTPARRFLRRTAADAGGAFSIRGLPFGTYHVAALPRLPGSGGDDWQDPAFLDTLIPRSSRVMISEAQKQTLSLRAAQ